jgi:hypothetical protein
MFPSFSPRHQSFLSIYILFDLYLSRLTACEGTQARAATQDPVACPLLLVSFPLVLLPLCLIISVDSHPHC